jgi:hypothetical protein
MEPATPSQPSFSAGRKWRAALNALLGIALVLAVLVMANYLSTRHFQRFYLSTQTRVELSPRTLHLLESITNRVRVSLYYSKDDPLYGDVAGLLKEYQAHDPRLSVETVDYERDPGAALDLKTKYDLGSSTNKDLVIFDCGGNVKIIPGSMLTEYTLEPVPNEKEREFRRKPVAFRGEMAFTSALLAVTSAKPLKAYFLTGHGEHRIDDATGEMGYAKFAAVLLQNHVITESLSLLTSAVPADCNLLVIAGPATPLPQIELDRIERYLNEGGRLLALFNALSADRSTGLEAILAKWGVRVTGNIVQDPDYTTTPTGSDVIVAGFSKNPAVNPLVGSQIQLILPREIDRLEPSSQAADGLQAEEIAFSGPRSFVRGREGPVRRRPLPLMAAVEKSPAKGVVTERGSTRILVVGDSLFLGNRQIESAANRDFAGFAANWLLDRTILLEGVGPTPIKEYRLIIPHRQLQRLQWTLFGAMPGGILLLGGLVWLRRRR